MCPGPLSNKYKKSHFLLVEGWQKTLENLIIIYFSFHLNLDFLILFQNTMVSGEIIWTNYFLRLAKVKLDQNLQC